ncbi:MAG: hypothetical protein HKN23_22250, partial [Verrucomicrobiales bacterium]|nr:hypothetical protein [Verrucomicrobiales bacterium]
FVASDLAQKDSDQPTSVQVEKLFSNLEEGFTDTADGLQIKPDAKKELLPFLDSYDLYGEQLDHVSEVLAEYASKIDERDDLHKNLKRVLSSKGAVILIVRETEMPGSKDAGYAFKQVIGELLESDKNGKLRVKKEKESDLSSNMKEALKTLREAARKGREFDKLTEAIADEELKEIYQSPTGKMIVVQMIQDEMRSLNFDGLALWIDEHFEKGAEGKLQPKAETTRLLARIVKRAEEIAANLKSDF